jgi:nickel-dependent lactate racemase
MVHFRGRLIDTAAFNSLIIQDDNLLREVIRKLQKQIWNKRCEETIELEKQLLVVSKDLKRKKKRVYDSDEERSTV